MIPQADASGPESGGPSSATDFVVIAGCGYVGSALAARLVAAGSRVLGIRRDPRALPPGVEPLAADLLDPDLEVALPRGIGAAVWALGAGARDEEAYRRAYVEGPARFVAALDRAGARPERLVYLSSTGVYGQDDGSRVDERSPTEPTSFTGRLVLEGEARFRMPGARALALRLGGLYGPGRTRLLELVRAGRRPGGDPRCLTNRIHRDDAAGAIRHLLALPDPQEVYDVVDLRPASISEVTAWIAARLGVSEPLRAAAAAAERRGLGKAVSCSRLVASGFRHEHPDFRSGYEAVIRETERKGLSRPHPQRSKDSR